MKRTAYEWETKIDKKAILNKIEWLKKEIKRISNTTLKGNFSNPEDKEYWIKRLTKLNSELSVLEQLKLNAG